MPAEEDLPALARLAFAEASRNCGDCCDYHATWVYRRIAGTIGGVEADRPALVPLIRDTGKRFNVHHWMIAGSADSGQLTSLAMGLAEDAGRARFTVIDRCPTPLSVCRTFAERAGLRVDTITAEFESFTPPEPYDAILAHSIIGFFPREKQRALLAHLRCMLRPGGVLIFCTRLRAGPSTEDNSERATRTIAAVRAAVAAGRVVFPEPQETFEQRLRLVTHDHDSRSHLPPTMIDAIHLLEHAGYAIDSASGSGHGAREMPWAAREYANRAIIVATRSGADV